MVDVVGVVVFVVVVVVLLMGDVMVMFVVLMDVDGGEVVLDEEGVYEN